MYRCFLKRLIDIFISSIMLFLLMPVWIFVPILIKQDDGGSILYRAERIGRDAKKITMLKFRTMKENSIDIRNDDGSTYNAEDDPRITKIGKLLRKTSIDELPQLVNVFLGDMSMIGPRPSEWNSLEDYFPEDMDKLKVRPGITGYTQAYFRNNITLREKRKFDCWYANNVTLLLDIKIFFKTIVAVINQENIYTNKVKK